MITVLSFFAGISVIAVIDMLIPEPENPHEFKIADLRRTGHSQDFEKYASLNRMGLMMALAIGIHNFRKWSEITVSDLNIMPCSTA